MKLRYSNYWKLSENNSRAKVLMGRLKAAHKKLPKELKTKHPVYIAYNHCWGGPKGAPMPEVGASSDNRCLWGKEPSITFYLPSVEEASDEELLWLLAHEIAHQKLGHKDVRPFPGNREVKKESWIKEGEIMMSRWEEEAFEFTEPLVPWDPDYCFSPWPRDSSRFHRESVLKSLVGETYSSPSNASGD